MTTITPPDEATFNDESEAPFYTDFLYHLQSIYTNFGLEGCIWDESYTYLNSNKDAIIKQFNEKYHFREIGAETETRWQYLLQVKLDRISNQYNRMFMMYKNNDTESIDRTITSNGRSRFQDTPVTELESDKYATNITDNSNTTTIKDSQSIKLINENIKQWNNLVIMFVDEFDDLFYDYMSRV